MHHGTGVDLWRQKKNWGNGCTYLSEARYIKDGKWHGFEWWLNEDQKSVWRSAISSLTNSTESSGIGMLKAI